MTIIVKNYLITLKSSNDRFWDLALDDYHGEMDEEGPIK